MQALRGRGLGPRGEPRGPDPRYGFTKDFKAEKFYRDVKLCTIGDGTSEIQRMVARQLLKA